MDLSEFLKVVDQKIQELTRKDLESFVHEYARTLPKSDRKHFLDIDSYYIYKH